MISSAPNSTDGSGLELSVIIVSWNTRDLLKGCLQAVFDSVQQLACEVILVDNASVDGSLEMVQRDFPAVRLIENAENAGYAKANNQGLREARGRCVLLLNSDAFLTGDALLQMLSVMDSQAQIGIAGARLIFPDGSPQLSHSPLPTLATELKSLAGLDKGLAAQAGDDSRPFVDTGAVSGACLMARKQMVDQIGPLDEDFFFYSEEVDWCARAHAASWRVVYVPAAQVIHVVGGSSGADATRVLLLYREKLRYFGKHHGSRTQWLLWMGMWLATLAKVAFYFLLRLASLGRVRKDRLWLEVARGLAQ